MNSAPVLISRSPVQQWIDRVGGPRRAQLIGLSVAMIALIFALSRWAAAPTWVPLYTGLPLETTGPITESLTEAGVRYQLEMGGSEVRVPSTDLARARVILAGSGLPSAGRPGLELFDQPSWGMTDYTQRINYRRALEGELERTISKMRGVESAQVHLAMQETSSIRRADRPSEASVVLQLLSGQTPPADIVQGISHLVASSVDGLASENVTVVDGTGRLLSQPDDPGSTAALNSRQLGVQREMEGYLEAKAEEIVTRIVGVGNARIQVSASVNFDRVERTVQSVDPERQAIATEERAEIIPGAEGGAGSTNQSATYENTRSVEVFSGATGTVRRLSVAVLVNDREVVDGETTQFEARSAAELGQIESLVRSAVGIDEARGDAISVVSVPFDRVALPEDAAGGTDVLGIVEQVQRPVIAVLGLLLMFIVALRLLALIRTTPTGIDVLRPVMGTAALGPAGSGGAMNDKNSAYADALPSGATLRDRVTANVMEQPDLAAKLVRGWLKEG